MHFFSCPYLFYYNVSVFYVHFSWFIFLFTFFISSLLLTLIVVSYQVSFHVLFAFLSLKEYSFSVSFFMDRVSCTFITVVLIIRTIIMLYSYNYMNPYSKPLYFIFITFLFISSMVLLITMSNFFFVMLGWDGLGLVSFLLIVYYQNPSSITSGLFTLIINRLGDCFFLVLLSLVFTNLRNFSFVGSTLPSFMLTSLLILTFITKRAIYPFSPWLPLAIAAPTPISALVHSSTLVTAGLYLMMRSSYLIFRRPLLVKLLLVFSLFTSFYAGLNVVFETDLKKLVALSTLSHLGFIGLAFSRGLVTLAFFHLLTHALFKSLLFIGIGDVIINLNHSQEQRYLSSGYSYTPLSSFIIFISIFNLLGIPSLRGFFSKDLILETFNYSVFSYVCFSVVVLNVVFTYYYSYQLFRFSFIPSKIFPYQNLHPVHFIHAFFLSCLGLTTLFFGSLFLISIGNDVVYVTLPLYTKLLPLSLNFIVFIFLYFITKLPSPKHSFMQYFYRNISGLSIFDITFFSSLYYYSASSFVRSFELGFANHLLNRRIPLLIRNVRERVVHLSSFHSLKSVFYFLSFVLVLIFIAL